MRYRVIDEEGTVVWEFRAVLPRDKIKVIKGVEEGKAKVGEGKQFVKLWRSGMPSGLTLEEYGMLYVLSTKVCYGDNGVREGGMRRGRAISAKWLSEELGVSYRRVLKILRSLKEKKAVLTIDGVLTVSPEIACTGGDIEREVLCQFTPLEVLRGMKGGENGDGD